MAGRASAGPTAPQLRLCTCGAQQLGGRLILWPVWLGEDMKNIAITLLCCALVSCTGTKVTVADPIDALVKKLNASNGFWINGLYPNINFPRDAEPNEVIAQAVQQSGFDQGHIKSYQIQEIRQVQLSTGLTETFSAALMQSDLGTKILLFKPEENNRWWTRFYDVP